METKPSKLRKVKTITEPLGDAVFFDDEVNAALAEGWYLVKRYTIAPAGENRVSSFIAELQRYDDYDE